MKIVTQGLSRIVFVYKGIAIKFPWINFLKLFKCFLKYKKEKSNHQKMNRFHKNTILAFLKALLHILNANRREYLYFKKHPEEKSLLPITKAFLFGHIIVQPKGDVFDVINPRWEKLSLKLIRIGVINIDLLTPENFCVHNGEIRLLDYGSDLTQEVLDSLGFEIINE